MSYDINIGREVSDTVIVEVPMISSVSDFSSSECCLVAEAYRVSGKLSYRDVEYSDVVEYHLTFTTVFRYNHQTDGVVTDVEVVSCDIVSCCIVDDVVIVEVPMISSVSDFSSC